MMNTITALIRNMTKFNGTSARTNGRAQLMLAAASQNKQTQSRRQDVLLPHPKPSVNLPNNLANVLKLLIAAGECGICTFDFDYAGIAHPKAKIYELRKLGAVITTVRGHEINSSGEIRPNIGRYFYNGWVNV
jgi:hypothetical protein